MDTGRLKRAVGGDAHLVLLAPLDLTRPLARGDRAEPVLRREALRSWRSVAVDDVAAALRGSMTYVDAEQDQVSAVLRVSEEPLAQLQAAMRRALPGAVDPACFRVLTCEALVLGHDRASDHSAVQGFTVGPHVLAVQFHPELTVDDVERLVDHNAPLLEDFGLRPADVHERVREHAAHWSSKAADELIVAPALRFLDTGGGAAPV